MRPGASHSLWRQPYVWHLAFAVPFLAVLTLAARRHLPAASISWLVAFLVAINLTVFLYYGIDKWQARSNGRRVPEVVLHSLALGGGSLGAYLAMNLFRHKTIKPAFRRVFWSIVAVQGLVLIGLAYLLWA